ncbi:3-oxoacyl-[acyl-carrier-protein] reductase [Parasphaerochaeta coccoides]|uniref:3-oxoacyl-[acyl-carrier-protein] reductase n=1 Tax=Parasphaerochaeta coccoides (strain ATCC BAA-1237 / DSM 17374 / SPN1) TaxID=760011 RepID=F4GJL6_PARC1|nr:3-oxoacyl-[acyl-carrier-protein] reductase [Parasphaerochaeta coccoides]AEC02763.1 3-oxoacyl-(acyl-carrier-protein) reductase [Parasphaerochaeta coccoides DSM 17374]
MDEKTGKTGKTCMCRGELPGRKALVTGGSRGIGHAIVAKLLSEGADVWYVSRNQSREHNALEDAAECSGGRVTWVGCDISDSDALEKAADRVLAEAGRVDILVNNAGITRDGLIMRMNRDAWDNVLQVNLTSAFVLCRKLARSMARTGGVIINMSSVVGLTGNGGQANYAASKAGLIGFSKSMARELASRNVRVNVVAPGFIDTEMTAVLPDTVKEDLMKKIPLGRLGKVEDVAQAVAFLVSDRASYITGHVLTVDGGMAM